MKQVLPIPTGAHGWVRRIGGRPVMPTPHSHEELELNVVLAGAARYLVDGTWYRLEAGGLLWLHPEHEHRLADATGDFAMWVAVFDRPLLAHALAADPDHPLWRRGADIELHRVGAAALASLDRLCERLHDLGEDPVHLNAGLHWLLTEAWAAWRSGARQGDEGIAHPAVRACLALLARGENGSVAELARRSGISPDRLSRLFRAEVGIALTAWRNRLRVERACRLLASDHRRTLEALAVEAGFGSYAQFHRSFRRYRGESPAGYRRRLQQVDQKSLRDF